MKAKITVTLAVLFLLIIATRTANAQPNWLTTGNTVAGGQFLGSNNSQPLIIRTGSVERMRVLPNGNVGIGTTAAEAKLHVFKGSAGVVTANTNAPLVVENSANNYINLLSPSANERGILFGDNLNAQDGGIVYVGSSNRMEFRTNGNITRMMLSSAGNVGIGTTSPTRKLQVQDGDARISRSTGTPRFLEFVSTAASQNDVRMEYNLSATSLFFSSSTNDFLSFTDIAKFDLTSAPTYVFSVFGSALASGGVWTNSDEKLKKGIIEFNSAMDIIKQLKPKTYFFKTDEYNKLNLPSAKQYGFIAQDVEKVMPELVKNSQQTIAVDESGERKTEEIKAINYSALIPILTKAMQEQDEKIKEQQQQINELKKMVNGLKTGQQLNSVNSSGSTTTNEVMTDAMLEQNIPNPLTTSTTISYSIPRSVKNAQLTVTDLSGKIVKQIYLNKAGAGNVNIDALSLGAGTYTYTLYADGKLLGSKKMIVAR